MQVVYHFGVIFRYCLSCQDNHYKRGVELTRVPYNWSAFLTPPK